jgi:hypothetical protein
MPSKVFGVRKPSLLHDGGHEPKAGWSSLNAFWYDWLLRGCERTFSPFHRRVVTTYALEVSAAGDGDYWDHSLSAFRAVRCSIHEILPNFFTPNQKLKVLFQSSLVGRVMMLVAKLRVATCTHASCRGLAVLYRLRTSNPSNCG